MRKCTDSSLVTWESLYVSSGSWEHVHMARLCWGVGVGSRGWGAWVCRPDSGISMPWKRP